MKTTVVCLLLSLLPIAKSAAVPVTGGLVGYWPAEGNGADQSGFGRDLTLNGGLSFSGGLVGQSFDLPANNSKYATRAVDDSAYDFGVSDFTLQVWANFNSLEGEHTLFEKFTGPGGPGWTLTQRSGPSLEFFASGAVNLDTGIESPIPGFTAHEWHHLVVRRSGTVFTLFFDNVPVASDTNSTAIDDTTENLRLGNRQGPQVFTMDGLIDEAAIWNRALSDDEVATLFSATVPEPPLGLLCLSGTPALLLWRRK